ncbi:pirin family protein [Clostridium sardiniense]|uniref:pirin family protein n=1 Tax=Clostridium sardiniense TaxID=29369 RepID=UPI00195A68F7|nr:pirin family protein [Clostridium sardiniense]MBM7833851.1 redox-sensitive bicupin YhaK (pirin superfamily) [Clostridium sardiniense]
MIRHLENKNMGKSNLGWLKSSFHFSFAEYFNIDNMHFGPLRVLNDDLIEAGTGFDTHPHENMEIITYIVSGELTHGDSMGNKRTLSRGNMQYMSAGTGVYHSEHNLSDDMLRLLQIWIIPDKQGLKPQYGDFEFNFDDRRNNFLHMVSSMEGNAPIKINQDVNIYTLFLEEGKEIEFKVEDGRQVYLVQIEGNSIINNIKVNERDALEIIEEDISIKSKTDSHFILIEMRK